METREETWEKENARQTSWFDNWKINPRRAISGSCERELHEPAMPARILISWRGRHLSSLLLSVSLSFYAHRELFHIHGAGSAVLLIPSSRGSRVAKRGVYDASEICATNHKPPSRAGNWIEGAEATTCLKRSIDR